MKTVDVLIAAKALIADEARFSADDGRFTKIGRIRGAIYEDVNGHPTRQRSRASCFCSLGALSGALGVDVEGAIGGLSDKKHVNSDVYMDITPATDEQRKSYLRAQKYLGAAMLHMFGDDNIVAINDSMLAHEDVIKAFDLAIKNAKRRHVNGDHGKKRNGTVSL